MDAADVVSKLHEIDPGFREVCKALYPGLDPREVADLVYKSEPSSADVHVNTTVWRNGRGNTKGRGRRKIDTDVKSTRYLSKADRKKLEHAIGLGTTGIGAGISAVALPKHLSHLPGAMRSAKTSSQPMSAGIKDAVNTVRNFSKPAAGVASSALGGAQATPKGIRTGLGALKEGAKVARANPRLSAGLAVGAAALHTANLGGEAIATHVLAGSKPKKQKVGTVTPVLKGWAEAQAMIIEAHTAGRISKADALRIGEQMHAELSRVAKAGFGYTGTSANIKLQTLKAPSPVKADTPHLTPNSINQPKAPKSGAGRKAGKTIPEGRKTAVRSGTHNSKSGVSKQDETSFAAQIEFTKVDQDKQQTFGWASVVKIDGKDVVDKQDDIIAIEEIEKAAYDYVLGSRAGGAMHKRTADGGVHKVADMIESFVLTPEKISKMGLPDTMPHGWWIGMKVHDDDVWADVKSGKLTGWSIHGTGKRSPELVMD